jgi:FixJ family two-component response regulator
MYQGTAADRGLWCPTVGGFRRLRETLFYQKRALVRTVLEVRTYQSGADFLEDNRKVACLIVDYNMPALNGFEVISELRKRGVPLPTIMITAVVDPTIERRAAELGVRRVLAKPLKTPVLLTVLRDAMRLIDEG